MSVISVNAAPADVQHFPADLRGYGTNPFGKPIYRCIWSESRLHQIGGQFPDGTREYRWVPLYPVTPLTPPCWKLEKWLPAVAFAGPRELYEADKDPVSGLIPTGPYPTAGEYDHCYSFPTDAPVTISMIESMIYRIEAGRRHTFAENRQAHLDAEANRRRTAADRAFDIWSDSQQAFGNLPSNVNPAKRTADKVRLDQPPPLPVVGDGKPFV
jgi:hypothetical protein